jgi:hypothetical protein
MKVTRELQPVTLTIELTGTEARTLERQLRERKLRLGGAGGLPDAMAWCDLLTAIEEKLACA